MFFMATINDLTEGKDSMLCFTTHTNTRQHLLARSSASNYNLIVWSAITNIGHDTVCYLCILFRLNFVSHINLARYLRPLPYMLIKFTSKNSRLVRFNAGIVLLLRRTIFHLRVKKFYDFILFFKSYSLFSFKP